MKRHVLREGTGVGSITHDLSSWHVDVNEGEVIKLSFIYILGSVRASRGILYLFWLTLIFVYFLNVFSFLFFINIFCDFERFYLIFFFSILFFL